MTLEKYLRRYVGKKLTVIPVLSRIGEHVEITVFEEDGLAQVVDFQVKGNIVTKLDRGAGS